MKYSKIYRQKSKLIGLLLLTFLLIQSFMGVSLATTAKYAQNYDDTIPEIRRSVNDNTFADLQNLRVTFNMSEGISLIRGVNFSYDSVGAGPHTVDIQFAGDSSSANYSATGIPYASSDTWRIFYCDGPIYLLDDAPAVNLIGTQPSTSCIRIGGDTPSTGDSYRDMGSGWIVDSYEYLIQLIYEWVLPLNISESVAGQITSSDNIDAYFVNLTAGVPYMFVLDRTSGTGNLNIRLVANQELTNNNLTQSLGTFDPEYLAYTPISNGTYVLLVEAETGGVDIADYTITYFVDNAPTSNTPSPVITTSTGTETIGWILYDDFGASYYRIVVNSTPSTWYTWINNTDLQYPINRSLPGNFNYTIQYNDTGNNWGLPDEVSVTILDSPPTSTNPDDVTTPTNSSASIPWILTDDYGAGYYRVFVNFTPSTWQLWINNTSIDYPINTSLGGLYDYVIQYNDSAGNLGTADSVTVVVVPDTTPPTSNQPSNITTTRSGIETIDWILSDNINPGYYRVLIESTPLGWNNWINNTNLQYPINRSTPGVFNYTIQFNDSAGIWGLSDTVFVTILDNPPNSTSPSDIITSTTSSASIQWVLTDDYGAGSYRVIVNSTPGTWQPWTNNTNLNIPVNTTLPGLINYTIQYNDSAGQLGPPNTVIVTILLDAPPTSSNPLDISTYVSYTETIGWILTDDAGAGFYRVLVNGSPSAWNPWINNTSLDYPINTTVSGIYSYMIDFNDSAGQLGISDTVIITIDIDDQPQSSQPSAITTYVGYAETIGWIITDDVGAGFYRVLVNGSPSTWSPYINGSSLNYPINTTIIGAFNYTIQYNDSFGQMGVPHTVIVSISTDDPPTSNQPSDIATVVNYVVYVGWVLTDDVGTGYYRVSINGTPGQWATWTSGTPVNYPINTSNLGVYDYTIEYNDTAGQWGTPDTVIITVTEPPPFPTSETQVNLTCSINGTIAADQTGFAIPVQGWNSTYLNMTVSDVMLYDYDYEIENDVGGGYGFRYRLDTAAGEEWVMGFNLTGSCTLDTIDFMYTTYVGILEWGIDTAYTQVTIYNATYHGNNSRIEPDQVIYNETELGLEAPLPLVYPWVSGSTAGYWNGTLTNKPILNVTNTYNGYFFIGFRTNSSFFWHYMNDADDAEGDQGIVYRKGFADSWYNTSTPTDLSLLLDIIPLQSSASPSELNMLLNSIPVTALGSWNTSSFLIPEVSGEILFDVSANWYNISFQANWTSQLLQLGTAVTSYYAEPQNPIVSWNVTIPAVFATGSYDKKINVTIPVTWNTTNVYYNTVEHNNNSWEEITNSKYVLIGDADNGMWIVTCDGANWIYDLTLSKSVLYTFDVVNITASLINPVFDSGNDTTQVFITDQYSLVLDDTLTGKGVGTFINLTWNVAQSIHTDGIYQIIVSWFNGTEAGMYNASVQVYNSTSIAIVSPEHRGTIIEMAKGQIFNLTIYYNMSYWTGSSWGTLHLNNTMGANVTYIFQGAAPKPMVNTTIGGYSAWTVTITSPNIYGTYPIYINATAWGNIQNYTNYLITLQVKQYGTNLIFNDTAKEVVWGTPIAYGFIYTNLTGHSIITDNITIDWKYDSDGAYRGVLLEGLNYTVSYNGGTEEYTITFSNFSAHTYKLLFHIEGDVYQSQQAHLTLIFNNRTTSLINQTNVPRLVYQTNGLLNITVYYEDLEDNLGISGGLIQSNWSLIKDYLVQEIGGGFYKLSLNVSSVALNNYSILISANKNNYEAANLLIQLEIYGYPTNITSLYAQNLTGNYAVIYAMENWTISFEYINASNGAGLTGATISATLGGEICAWQNGVNGNYTVWADASKLIAPVSGQNYTLSIIIEKGLYETQIIIITVNITDLPTQLYPEYALIAATIDDFFEIRVQLNDTYNQLGVDGTVWYDFQGQQQEMHSIGILGLYSAIINLTDYVSGVYQINISSWAVDYQNASINIALNVSRLKIYLIPESDPFTGYTTVILNTTIQIKDSKNRIVENLNINYNISTQMISGSFSYIGNGIYSATINITALPAGTYTLQISSMQTVKFNQNITDFSLDVVKIPTMVIPAELNITGYYGNEYLLTVTYLNTLHGLLISGTSLEYEIQGQIPFTTLTDIGGGSYQAILNLTDIGIGSYIINVQTTGASAIYQDANKSIDLNILPKIQTKLIINISSIIEVGEILNISLLLQAVDSTPIANQIIIYSISTEFHNGSDEIIQSSLVTNTSGMGIVGYLVPFGAYYINILGTFLGAGNLTETWNSSLIFVESISYNLTVQVQSSINVGESLLIQAFLSNQTHPISGEIINFTIIVLVSEDVSMEYHLNGTTNSNGTVSITFEVPENALSIYIFALYTNIEGKVTSTEPQIVIAVDPWSALWQRIALPVAIIALLIILGISGFYLIRRARSRFMSLESKKRQLLQRRAENRKEITIITQGIQQIRSETLKEAEAATKAADYVKAAKLYDKAGNLTLELADKSVAREFFLKAKEIEKLADKDIKQKDLKGQRDKLLDKARSAIRERDIIEASRNYRQVAEISRILGEREQAAKFLKLADAAHERIEALKEGDLRKKSGVYLSKADKSMGKQNFLDAAKNFEEAAKLMLMLGDDEGIKRFTGWAKLAREREILKSEKTKEEWENEMIETQKELIREAKGLVRVKNYEAAAEIYSKLTIYALELGNLASVKKFKKDIDFCRKQAALKQISPETVGLMRERKKLLANAEEAIKNNRYAAAARYYKRIATISESIEGKEVARTYMRQANYYLDKVKEKRLTKEIKVEEETLIKKRAKPIAKVADDELEETKAKLATTVKNARGALKTGKSILAKELYEKASLIAATIGDKESELRYSQKAEEIGALRPQRKVTNEGVLRKNITVLMKKAEKALQKKKYREAKDSYEEISELFIQLGDEDAANDFLERANSVRRLIKK